MKRGCMFWVCVVCFFPISLLLFLIPKKEDKPQQPQVIIVNSKEEADRYTRQ